VAAPTVTDNYVAPAATYALTASPVTQSNEGASVTFTLATTNLAANTPVPYTIASTIGLIESVDFGGASLTGSFTTNAIGVGTATFNLTADTKTEGDETFTLSLNNGAASITYVIKDTSLSAGYTLAISPTGGNESSTATITLTTTGVANGTSIPFVITGTTAVPGTGAADPTADFTNMRVNGNIITTGATGNFIVNSNQSTLTITMSADLRNEGFEAFTVSLGSGFTSNSVTYTITDSSATRITSVTWGAASYLEGFAGVVNWTIEGTDFDTIVLSIQSPNLTIPPFTPGFTDTSLRTYTTPPLNGLGIHSVEVRLFKGSTLISTRTATISVGSGATYALTRSAISAQETFPFTFTLTTSNVAANTLVPFTITRSVTTVPLATDFSSWVLNGSSITPSLTGSFKVGSTGTNQATLVVTPARDRIDEGVVTFTLTLDSPLNANTVSTEIQDLNTADPFSFVTKTNQTPNTSITSDNVTIAGLTINRSITITATGGTVDAGTTALSGTFAASKTVTSSGTGTILVAARVTSGAVSTSSTVTITCEGVSGTFTVTTAGAVIPTYTWTAYPTSINEGTDYTYTVGTTNVPNGTVLYWAVTAGVTLSDFTQPSGTVTINSNTGSFIIRAVADNLTEPALEITRVLLKSGSVTGPDLIPPIDCPIVTINDTSQTPITPSYNWSNYPIFANEDNITINVVTTNVPNGTTLYWQAAIGVGFIPGGGRWATAADFVGGVVPSGSFTVSNNIGNFSVGIATDSLTEGNGEAFQLYVSTGSNGSDRVLTGNLIAINDTSQTPGPTYAFDTVTNPIPASVNEGSNFTVRVNTTGVANGTNLSWAVSNTPGLNDVDQTSPTTFAINGNTGTFTLTAIADALTEPGTETFTITIYAGTTPVLTSNSITINDTSQTSYTIESLASVNEGEDLLVTVRTAYIRAGQTIYWRIDYNSSSQSSDFQSTSGSSQLVGLETYGTSVATFYVRPVADNVTDGSKTFKIIISETNNGTSVVTSSALTINDTSQAPPPVTVNPNLANLEGTWFTNTASTSAPPLAIGTIYFNRNGSYSLVIYGDQYVIPVGTSYVNGPYANATVASGAWTSTASSTVGDNFWVRFRGTYNVDNPGARIDGYDNSSGVASPLIRQSAAGNFNFNSGWLSLGSDRAISINSGGDASGGEGRIFNMTIEISSNSSGSNIVSTTSNIAITAATYYGGGGDGGGSISINAYMPYTNKLAGTMIVGDPLLLLSPDGKGTVDGSIISNRISQQKLLTLVSSSEIRLTCSDNTPLTLQDGSCINSTEALGKLVPVQDSNGFRWEEIVEVIDAGMGEVATIFCDNQCYAAGDEPNRWIWTHNLLINKI
jgi:hypothetical protein